MLRLLGYMVGTYSSKGDRSRVAEAVDWGKYHNVLCQGLRCGVGDLSENEIVRSPPIRVGRDREWTFDGIYHSRTLSTR
jgi:hypothetical protein